MHTERFYIRADGLEIEIFHNPDHVERGPERTDLFAHRVFQVEPAGHRLIDEDGLRVAGNVEREVSSRGKPDAHRFEIIIIHCPGLGAHAAFLFGLTLPPETIAIALRTPPRKEMADRTIFTLRQPQHLCLA